MVDVAVNDLAGYRAARFAFVAIHEVGTGVDVCLIRCCDDFLNGLDALLWPLVCFRLPSAWLEYVFSVVVVVATDSLGHMQNPCGATEDSSKY